MFDPGLRRDSAGYTLVELLVVIAIILVIATSVSATLLTDTGETQIREGSRALTAFLNKVRDKAVSTGQPHGVLFHRAIDSTGTDEVSSYATRVSMIKPNEGYTGDSPQSRMLIHMVERDYLEKYPHYQQYVDQGKSWAQWAKTAKYDEFRVHGIGIVDPTQTSTVTDAAGQPMQVPGKVIIPDVGLLGKLRNGSPVQIQGSQFSFSLRATDPDTQVDPETQLFIELPTEDKPYELSIGSIPAALRAQPATGFPYSITLPPTFTGDSMELPDGVCVDLAGSNSSLGPRPNYRWQRKWWESDPGRSPNYKDLASIPPEDLIYPKSNPYLVFYADGTTSGYLTSAWTPDLSYQDDAWQDDEFVSDDDRLSESQSMQWQLQWQFGAYGSYYSYGYSWPTGILLGKTERAGVPLSDLASPRNWHDPSSIWVSIHQSTGRVRSSPVVAAEFDPNNSPYTEISYSMQALMSEQTLGSRGR